MRRRVATALAGTAVLLWLAPAAAAQTVAQRPPAEAAGEAGTSNIWFVAGATFTAVRSNCQTCEQDFPYRQSGSFLADVGYRVHTRMDVGAEVFWVPVNTEAGDHIRTTHLDAVAQFRPWSSKGFVIKGGAGMAFVRNWVDLPGTSTATSKALSLVIGAGWVFRPAERFGVQVFGAQHAAALGDVQTSLGDIQDVMANFWSVGIAVVIR